MESGYEVTQTFNARRLRRITLLNDGEGVVLEFLNADSPTKALSMLMHRSTAQELRDMLAKTVAALDQLVAPTTGPLQ
jgi:hypothetical protein